MTTEMPSAEWKRAAADKRLPSDKLIGAFEREIARQESVLFGVALFFDGLSLLFDGQEALIETHRRQFRNIIRGGRQVSRWARNLLEEARREPGKARFLRDFNFMTCQEHPDPEGLVRRACILADTYNTLFPGREKDRSLGEDELQRLVQAASEELGRTEAPGTRETV